MLRRALPVREAQKQEHHTGSDLSLRTASALEEVGRGGSPSLERLADVLREASDL